VFDLGSKGPGCDPQAAAKSECMSVNVYCNKECGIRSKGDTARSHDLL